jgi:hypothetical protein
MLSFVDQEKNIKVFRVTPDGQGVHRERLGVVAKKDLTPGDEFKDLPDEEKVDLQSAVEFYRRAADAKVRAAVLSFPQTVREVVAYVAREGNEFDRKMVLMSLLEGARQMRIANRATSQLDKDE